MAAAFQKIGAPFPRRSAIQSRLADNWSVHSEVTMPLLSCRGIILRKGSRMFFCCGELVRVLVSLRPSSTHQTGKRRTLICKGAYHVESNRTHNHEN